uniref:Uncharacterized protein n=1 Tax=Alexandrium monilatum TaxID=311494 RepID=A0A7S4S300_9DINO
MAPAAATRKLTIEIPSDLDVSMGETEEEEEADAEGPCRFALPRRMRWPLAVTGALAAVLLLVGAAVCRSPEQLPQASASLANAPVVAAFAVALPNQQCGGADWHGASCCTTGCACVAETPSLSRCRPANGTDRCDSEAALGQARRAVEKVAALTGSQRQRRVKAESAAQEATEAKALAAEAEAAKGRAAEAPERTARDKAAAWLKEAEAAAAQAAQAVEDKDASGRAAREELRLLEQTDAMQATRSCAAVSGQCAGPALDQSISCCALGCICKRRSDQFSSCEAVGTTGRCDPSAADARAGALRAQTASLQEELQRAHAAKASAESKAREAAAEAAKAREAATQADVAFAKAEKAAKEAAVAASEAEEEASRSADAVKEGRLAMRRWTQAAVTWKMAAEGCGCEGDRAAEWARRRVRAALAGAQHAEAVAESDPLGFLRDPSSVELQVLTAA